MAKPSDGQFFTGYVVLNSGDTLKGFILIQDQFFNSRNCVFKKTENSTPSDYSIQEITAYGIRNKKYYKRHTVTKEPSSNYVFLECLIKGNVSLYLFDDRFFLESQFKIEELTIDKRVTTKDNQQYAIKVEAYKGVLQEAMKDCSNIFSLIGTTLLKKIDLIKLLDSYYDCVNKSYFQFEVDEYKVNVNLSVTVGSALSSFRIVSGGSDSYIFLIDKKPTYTTPIILSFPLEYSQISLKNKIRIRTGAVIMFANNKLNYEYPNGNLKYELMIKSIRLEVPLVVKYNLLNDGKGLYILGGFGFNTFLKWDEHLRVKAYSSGNVLSNYSKLEGSNFFASIHGGLGYNFQIRRQPLFFELDYNGTQVLKSKSNSPTAFITNFGVSAGFAF